MALILYLSYMCNNNAVATADKWLARHYVQIIIILYKSLHTFAACETWVLLQNICPWCAKIPCFLVQSFIRWVHDNCRIILKVVRLVDLRGLDIRPLLTKCTVNVLKCEPLLITSVIKYYHEVKWYNFGYSCLWFLQVAQVNVVYLLFWINGRRMSWW